MSSFEAFSFLGSFYWLFLLLNSIYSKIIVFFSNLLPIRYMNRIVGIIYFFFADFFKILPLFFLMRSHNMTFWRFIEFCLGYIVYETRIASFLAYVYSPHLEFLASWRISILTLLICEILSENKVLLIRKLYRCSKHTFCSFSDKLMNRCLSTCYYTVAINLNFFLKLWPFSSFRNICSTQYCILLLLFSFFPLFCLDFYPLKFDLLLLVL